MTKRRFLLGCQIVLLLAVMTFITSCSTKENYGKVYCVESSDGQIISYNVFGDGDVTLVFIHGLGCDSRYWREQIPYFAEKYRMVTVDLAGHGNSQQTRKIYSLEAFGQDVKAVVEKLDADKVILIGHSLGGGVIAEAAKLMPNHVIGLIGVDTLQNVEESVSKEEVTQIAEAFKRDFKAAVKPFVESMMVKDMNPELRQWIIDDISSANPAVMISAFEEFMAKFYNKALANTFKETKVPVKCVNSDLWPTDVEANRRYMSSFDVYIIKGVGHFPMLERPDEFNKLLNRSIKEIIRDSSH